MNPRHPLVFLLAAASVVFAVSPSNAAQADAAANAGTKPSLTANEIISRLEQRNRERAQALRKFQGTRVYRIQYSGFFGNRDAEMTVKVAYTSPNEKEFTIVSTSGTKFIVDHVLKGMLDGEKEAGNAQNMRRTGLSSENYEFTLATAEDAQETMQYVLNVIPKTDYKYLYRGKIWVDARDFAVTRIQAEPAKSPSFWVKKSQVNHKYEKVGEFWLPEENKTESQIRLGGHALLSIEYKDYEITETVGNRISESSRAGAEAAGPKSGSVERSDDPSRSAKPAAALDRVGGSRQ